MTLLRAWRGSLLLLAAAAAGCGGSGAVVQPPVSAAASSTGEYLISAGDSLEIFVWREPELSVTVPVRPDGRISTPLVGDISAVDKTPQQLASEIQAELSQYIRSPEVNVIVQAFVGTFGAEVRVMGQAAAPRAIPYRNKLTLLDVIIEAGGLTQFAAGNRSRVVRNVNGQTEEIRVRLDDLVRRGETKHNILMQPGDIVVIPEAVF